MNTNEHEFVGGLGEVGLEAKILLSLNQWEGKQPHELSVAAKARGGLDLPGN